MATNENVSASGRRSFLKQVAAGTAAAGAVAVGGPGLSALSVTRSRIRDGARAAAVSLDQLSKRAREATVEDEAFWEIVKGQFPLRPDLILMNAANLCPSPYPVQDAVFRLTRDVDQDASFQNRAKFGGLAEKSREALARFLGASTDEIAITRNTSESNNTILNGLSLGADDEVVIWDQNHPTNNISWQVRAERWGFGLKRVSTPNLPTTAEELLAPFRAAMSDRTRVIAFSHVSNVTGVALPAKELCSLAREAGAAAHVDGAQSFGALDIDVHDMGCDFYTGSAHKWFVGPKEAGVLYVRNDRIPELWASDVGVGWEGAINSGGARKFDNLGQRDDAAIAAIATTVEFHEAISPALVEARVRALAIALKDAVRARIPSAEFHTSDAPERSAGVVIVKIPVDDQRKLYGWLYDEHHIAGGPRGAPFDGVRICPHIYNTMEEVERVADAFAAAL